MKEMLISILVLFSIVFFCVLGTDYMNFERVQKSAGKGGGAWYDARWWKSPYMALEINSRDSREYITTNATFTEEWHCKETMIDGQAWWTILERKDIKK